MNDHYAITVPVSAETQLILERLDQLEARIMVTQADIDALATRISAAAADIRSDIADLKAANPDLDLTALESKVAGLEGLALENPPSP